MLQPGPLLSRIVKARTELLLHTFQLVSEPAQPSAHLIVMFGIQQFQILLENDQLSSALFQSRPHRLDITAQSADCLLAKGLEARPVLVRELIEAVPHLAQPGTHLIHIGGFGLQA